jgi:hypothetical protein
MSSSFFTPGASSNARKWYSSSDAIDDGYQSWSSQTAVRNAKGQLMHDWSAQDRHEFDMHDYELANSQGYNSVYCQPIRPFIPKSERNYGRGIRFGPIERDEEAYNRQVNAFQRRLQRESDNEYGISTNKHQQRQLEVRDKLDADVNPHEPRSQTLKRRRIVVRGDDGESPPQPMTRDEIHDFLTQANQKVDWNTRLHYEPNPHGKRAREEEGISKFRRSQESRQLERDDLRTDTMLNPMGPGASRPWTTTAIGPEQTALIQKRVNMSQFIQPQMKVYDTRSGPLYDALHPEADIDLMDTLAANDEYISDAAIYSMAADQEEQWTQPSAMDAAQLGSRELFM